MNKKIDKISQIIRPILEKYHIKKASIFGSFSRGREKRGSDIDILVEMGDMGGLFVMSRMKNEMEKVLGRKVDLLTYRSIHPLLRKNIMNDQILIYNLPDLKKKMKKL
jgi:uncharacterized protein